MNVFITGSTTGIGFHLALHYLQGGHRVGISGRNLSKLPDGFMNQYPQAVCYEVDVTDQQKMKESIEDFIQGGLDIVIANAGISDGRKAKKPDFTRSRQIMNTNVMGLINTFEPALEQFYSQGHGQLVAMASVAGFIGLSGSGAYCGSKAAVLKMCESLSLDLAKENIHVTAICPGFIDTPLTRQNKHSMPFLMPVEQAVIKIEKAINAKRALYMFPLPMAFVVTFLNKIPRKLYRFLMGLSLFQYSKETS